MSMPFDHFDFIAPFYERVIPLTEVEGLLEVVRLPVDGTLLDAGGGTGRVAAALCPHVREIVLVDVSAGMLAQARAKKLTALNSYSEYLPFASDAFERVLMVDALHHVINQRQTIAELYRVLKPGGRLVIEEPDLRTFAVKLIAMAEKLALMRSHFLAPEQVVALFPVGAQVTFQAKENTAWIIAEKPSPSF